MPNEPAPDRDIIEAHLEAIFGAPGDLHDGLIEIAHGRDGPDKAHLFTIDELADASEYAARVNIAGDQVYVGGALRKPGSRLTGRCGRDDVYGSVALWADADSRAQLDGAVAAYRTLGCSPDLIVITGTIPEHRGHFWWRLDLPVTDLIRLEAALVAIARALGTDAVVDAPRVMRLAGTVNWPRKPDRVAELVTMRWRNGADSLTSFTDAWAVYGADQSFSAAHEPLDLAARTLTGRFDLIASIALAARPGKWHDTLVRVVAHLAGLGRPDDEILVLCRAFTLPGYAASQTDADIAVMLKGARAKGWAADATRIEAAPPPEPEAVKRPQGLPDLPETLVPKPFLDYARERAEAMQVPIEYLVVPMMIAAGNVAAGRIALRPRKSEWLVTTNLWGAIVGPPGSLKSPAISAALRPLRRVEAKAWETYHADRQAWEITGRQGPEPVPRRFATNDATESKLAELLRANPNGLLLVRDELKGWLSHMANPARSAERQFFLEAWSGLSPYTQDRIGRGTTRIDRLCLGILGGLQPDVFQREFLDRAEIGGNDGLIQRFQLLIWPEPNGSWNNVDRWPNPTYAEVAHRVFERLAELEPETIGESHPGDACPWVRFNPAGEEIFLDFYASLEKRLRSGKLPQLVDGHLAKYRSLMPALALIIQLIENPVRIGPCQVGERAARMALDWCEHLRKVAVRIYSMPSIRAEQAIAAVAAAIASGKLAAVRNRPDQSFTCRDLTKLRIVGIGSREDAAQTALDALVENGALSVVSRKGRGRGGFFLFYSKV